MTPGTYHWRSRDPDDTADFCMSCGRELAPQCFRACGYTLWKLLPSPTLTRADIAADGSRSSWRHSTKGMKQ